jgi:hypothetical protein
VLAGRAGEAGEIIWDEMTSLYRDKITLIQLGEQPVEIISALLQHADFGVATSPWHLVGKSGTVAAMLDHGLPVVVTRNDFQPFVGREQPPTLDPLVHRCDEFLEVNLAAGLPRRPARPQAPHVAARLMEILATP